MFALDLFNTRYERDLREGAVDDLEARRIDDLNAKMDDLLARARTAKTPEHKAGLKREFEKVKNERDSYFKIKEQQVPSKQDPFAYVKPEPKGIGDLQDPKQKMAQLQQKAKKGPLANVGAGLKAFFKGEPEPMDEQVDQSSSGPRAYGVANFQRLVKANMGNVPTVTLEFAKSEDNIKLNQAGIDLISDYYDGLNSDQTKNHFIYRVLPSADEVRTVLKKLGWNPQAQQPLPGIPTQGELPLAEKKKFDNSSDLEAGDVKVARELQKLRAQYPAARSDLEAVARAELDSSERSQQQLAAIKGANEKQDALLKQLVSLDQEQGREIDDLDQENNTLEKRLAQVQSTNDRLQQAIGKMTGTKKADSKSDTTKVNKSSQDNADNINDKVSPVAEPAPKEKSKSAPTVTPKPEKVNTKSAAIDSMARQIAGFNQPAPELDATVSDKETDTDSDVIQRPAKLRVLRPKVATNADEFKLTAESDIREQSNTDDDWYDDEDQETELRSGDYVRDTMDGEHGEIFRMQGDPYERRVRILDRDGKGWYIEPSRLIRVDANDMDVQRYFGKKRVRDMDEGINEGLIYSGDTWQDVLYRINMLNDIFGDQRDLADTFEPASQPEWIPFRDRILRSRTVLDTYAKVKQLANMNVPLTDVEIEMLDDVAWDGGGGPVEPAGHWGERDYDWLEDLYAQQFAVVQHLLDQKAQGRGQNKTKSGQTVHEQGVAEAEGEYKVYYMTAEDHKLMGRYASREEAEQRLNQLQSEYPDNKFIIWKNSKQGVAEAANVNPQFIDTQVTKILAGEARRMTNAPMEQLLAPVMKQYGLTLQQIDGMVPGGLKKAAASYGIMMKEGWSDAMLSQRTGQPRTPYSVYIKGRKWKDFANDDHARAVMDKLKAKFKADGRDPETITIAPTDIPEGMVEAEKEPTTRQELLNRVDKIQRMMSQERNPANLQILRKELEMIKQRYQHLKEDSAGEAVERAILNRIMVAHTDLLIKFGPDKVMQAAEEVAYNVGDVDEIGTSDVSAYVRQVKQILGVPEEVNEKWSQKYKSSINCASPKGFSQRAHCAGKKK